MISVIIQYWESGDLCDHYSTCIVNLVISVIIQYWESGDVCDYFE